MTRPVLFAVLLLAAVAAAADPVVVGSKNFAENYILAEAAAQLLESRGYDVRRRFGLNGTKIVSEALRNGSVDLYPEYTGTVTEVILERPGLVNFDDIQTALAGQRLQMLAPLGFDNSYAIAVTTDFARQHELKNISDLAQAGQLRIGLPHEFLSRSDGWTGLKSRYGIDQTAVGIEHSLAYEALTSGKLDVTAVYSTDGEILRSQLLLLHDDLAYFPQYRATFLTRDDLPEDVVAVIELLSGRIDNLRMQRLNLEVLDPQVSFADAAAALLLDEGLVESAQAEGELVPGLWRNTRQHLKLTGIALALAILAGVGVAALVYAHPRASSVFLYFTGLLQTVPSIALLALLIPVLGIGEVPAIAALFLYSLLPIARSTITALLAIPPGYKQVAAAMGMTRRQQMRYVLLPLAMPHVISGIRTAAVISIGTATLAAFIGAGGLGDPIVTGLALNDSAMILQGAGPAAALAILTELSFGALERCLVVPHMRGRQT
ncbi:MAG: ABC transporter permease subunit [Woeseiaceae bacterium]|nr:ABC transporter permease subunit [Woeseiaceae bacterium]